MIKFIEIEKEKIYTYFKINKRKNSIILFFHILSMVLMIPIDLVSAILSLLFNKKISYDLIVFDDTFPNLGSPWRIASFVNLMKQFANSVVISTDGNILYYLYHKYYFKKKYPDLAPRVKRYNPFLKYKSKIAYIMFLHNCWYFLDKLESCNIPFITGFYPGGFFFLNDLITLERIKRIVASKNFKLATVLEKVIYNYLTDNNLIESDKLVAILQLPYTIINYHIPSKKYFDKDKQTFDICFVAYKQMPRGVNKGYDVFIDVAKILVKKHDNIFFHIVGNFDETDIDISDIKNRIKFYGTQKTEFFPEFYSTKDIILAPLKPSSLNKGSFDGFPTAAVKEASMCGVAMFAVDELKANYIWKEDEEIVIVKRETNDIVKKIEYYYEHLDELYSLSRKAQELNLKNTFDSIEFLKKIIEKYI